MSKSKNFKKYIGLAGILFLFPLVWILFFGVFSDHKFKTLPYFGPEAMEGADTSFFSLPPFSFTNQNGEITTLESLRGKVWLAAFYSTNNEHIGKITERLLDFNFRYLDEPDIAIVCFSSDCNSDSLPVIREYVDRNTAYNTFQNSWQFLTAHQDSMQAFYKNGFFINDLSNEAIFRLVDDHGQVRGLYGNTEYHMRDAIEDVALLKKEIDQKKYDERKKNEKAN